MKQALLFLWLILVILLSCSRERERVRETQLFTAEWKFASGDHAGAEEPGYDDGAWRVLTLPHDWSIEGKFSPDHPAGTAGGALPAGVGWYRKTFRLGDPDRRKQVYLEFGGIYRNGEVWINGHYLGKRPYGYSSFVFDISEHVRFGEESNTLAVKVDNSLQPGSRWYTGSGIYRDVWLITTGKIHIAPWGTYVTTPDVKPDHAGVVLEVTLLNREERPESLRINTEITAPDGRVVAAVTSTMAMKETSGIVRQTFDIRDPQLWSVETPQLYRARTLLYADGELTDDVDTPFGIRYYEFHATRGFSLNGNPLKIKGVNLHHDLGALGSAFHRRAAERQLEILKGMGCNAIRTAHNPPASEFLELCDRMGFLVVNEIFDMWAKKKNKYDYAMHWEEWHERDLLDWVRRDRNHPSVIAWSIGNEIREQFDSTGLVIARELAGLVKSLDTTRPVTCALTEQDPAKNFIFQSGALDLISFNYKHTQYPDFPGNYPGKTMVASENVSAIATRGSYLMPSDSIRVWPAAHGAPLEGVPSDFTGSAYDNVHAYWGATHRETWNTVANYDFIAGMFVWSGFDYLGEPYPFPWPARSSYFGVVDLCGFPKDSYYFYQSLWSDIPVLHLFPPWNWQEGETVDVWAYYNQADSVELFLNGVSQGTRAKESGQAGVMWRVTYEPGTLRAVSLKNGITVLEKEVHSAGKAVRIEMEADRQHLLAGGRDLAFVKVKITDARGITVPDAANRVNFEVKGAGSVAAVDNGYPAGLESFRGNGIKAFNGLCLLVVRTGQEAGSIHVTAHAEGLSPASLELDVKK
ncbi:MAG TPA: glycoside hydrolase family 2 TIM barrel-domain containing protein [Prolixibacteraceae bacterium]|nr:glycoside hydrolase family 2 TIM barrel-domain containing protein [Prolixibacteraceae bacterium]HOS00179.1 glycoside hydrolase family 2 TIM barrel-domain containing protein [Prolixibacteraceae bacterium]HPL45250.1 glycoside hydrolase family 2 TIM barrel-domain containing protein [Prolixibacteraceae bacterium]